MKLSDVVNELSERGLLSPKIIKAICEVGGPSMEMTEVADNSHGFGFSHRSDITWRLGQVAYNYRSFGRDPDFGTPRNTLRIGSDIVAQW